MILHGSDGATALLDLYSFVVGAHELVDGEWWLLVETTADLVGCPAVGCARSVMVGDGCRCAM